MPRAGKETRSTNDGALAGLGSSNRTPGINLKGEGSVSAIGKCVSVLYDEGEASLVAYRGVVVYLEHSRHGSFPPGFSKSPPPSESPLSSFTHDQSPRLWFSTI